MSELLALDRRAELGSRPGTHALVIGISKYPHLGPAAKTSVGDPEAPLRNLTAAARSAWAFQSWLRLHADSLSHPLKTLRVLVAPSDRESDENAELKNFSSGCTQEDVLPAVYAWKEDASRSRADATMLYFCGNGFDLSASAPTLVLGDYGSQIGPRLRGAVAVNNIVQGMAPSLWMPEVARTQLYFIDAGRRNLPGISGDSHRYEPSTLFDVLPVGIDERCVSLCHASVAGSRSYAKRNGITYFLTALMQCLEGRAAVPAPSNELGAQFWEVTTDSLARLMPVVVRECLAAGAEAGPDAQEMYSNFTGAAVIVRLKTRPVVPVRVEVSPVELLATMKIEVVDEAGEAVTLTDTRLGADAMHFSLPAGLYSVRLSPGDGAVNGAVLVSVMPPAATWALHR